MNTMTLLVKQLRDKAMPALKAAKNLTARPLRMWEEALLCFFVTFSTMASAQSGPLGAVSGLCKLTQFISGTVVLVVLAGALAIFAILHSINAAREGVMETAMRISLGGGAALSAVAIIGFVFNTSVC